jgi:hypothetical protein
MKGQRTLPGYLAGPSCLALVLSPLFIPVAITVVDWLRNWRPNPTVTPAPGTQRRAPAPKTMRRTEAA